MLLYRCKACLLAIVQLATISGTCGTLLAISVVVLPSFGMKYKHATFKLCFLFIGLFVSYLYPLGHSLLKRTFVQLCPNVFWSSIQYEKRVVVTRCLPYGGSKSFRMILFPLNYFLNGLLKRLQLTANVCLEYLREN